MKKNTGNIACLGWGSLIWDPRNLPVKGKWFEDGPILPIEFLRTSKDGRLTLVIHEKLGTPVRTLWTLLDCEDLNEAKNHLCLREECKIEKVNFISTSNKENNSDFLEKTVYDWANTLKLEGVVWTGLGAKFDGKNGKAPTCDEAIAYLKKLGGVATQKAEEYIRKAGLKKHLGCYFSLPLSISHTTLYRLSLRNPR